MVGILIRLIIVGVIIGGILLWYKMPDQSVAPHADANGGALEDPDEESPQVESTASSDVVTPSSPGDAPGDNIDAPTKMNASVPFIVQAPSAQWDDERFQDACEEASLLMAHLWLTGNNAPAKDEASRELEDMFAVAEQLYGEGVIDTSAEDTAKLFKELYGHDAEIIENMTLDEMYNTLASNSLIIVPTNGRALNNPYFNNGGPERHMLVITGYDKEKGIFVTNDPGTKRGKEYIYQVETLYNAVRDYPTGHKEPLTYGVKKMIVVKK